MDGLERREQQVESHVDAVLKAAQAELRELQSQRANIVKKIGTVKQTILGLVRLFGHHDVVVCDMMAAMGMVVDRRQKGLTPMCRLILMEARIPISAREAVERIRQKGASMLREHKNPVASVNTVLNRLVSYGEANAVQQEHGQRAWQWAKDYD